MMFNKNPVFIISLAFLTLLTFQPVYAQKGLLKTNPYYPKEGVGYLEGIFSSGFPHSKLEYKAFMKDNPLLNDSISRTFLFEKLKTGENWQKEAAIRYSKLIGKKDYIIPIVNCIKDGNERFVSHGISALGRMGFTEAVPYLGELLLIPEKEAYHGGILSALKNITSLSALKYLTEFRRQLYSFGKANTPNFERSERLINFLETYNASEEIKKRLMEAMVKDERYVWATNKIYQQKDATWIPFLRRYSRELMEQAMNTKIIWLLELRVYLGDDEFNEQEKVYLQRYGLNR